MINPWNQVTETETLCREYSIEKNTQNMYIWIELWTHQFIFNISDILAKTTDYP